MARDNQKITKKDSVKSDKKKDLSTKKKLVKNSDSDNDEFLSDDEVEMDQTEYRKFLNKIFPSKYLTKKINEEKSKKEVNNEVDDDDEDDEDEWETESEEEIPVKKSKKTKVILSDSEEEKVSKLGKSDKTGKSGETNKYNIIFTIGGADKDEYEEDYFSEDDSDYLEDDEETEDEDVSVSSDDTDEDEIEKVEKKKSSKENLSKEKKSKEKSSKEKRVNEKLVNEKLVNTELVNTELVNTELVKNTNNEVLIQLKKILGENTENDMIRKCIEVCEEDMEKTKHKNDKKEKKTKDKHLRIFKKIVKDKNIMNDYTFYDKLNIVDQKKIIKELREINKITRIEKPYRITLLESDIPTAFKGAAMKKINSLRYMEPGSGEFYKIKNWVDTFMRIPFGNYQTLPIQIEDGVDKCHEFMETAKTTLNEAVYGLNDAKMQIMQMLGQLLTNPKSIGTAIAIHGPPGTGKTSLVKEGISKILNRPFAFIALGGATDSSFLEGHSYTYEGSTWGKIVQILIDSKCMNPVIYFDELDKISDTPRGEEIAGILTHLTDTSQNSQFHDKYFAEINFDLSKCLFIFSYNDKTKVNSILKDRMYQIQTKGYNLKQKTVIGYDYLLPRIHEQVKFDKSQIIIPEQSIHHIIETYCDKEDGVRNLKRCLEIIHTKLNLYRLMKPDSNLFEEDMSLKVEFPFTVTKDIVDKLIKKDTTNVSTMYSMYV